MYWFIAALCYMLYFAGIVPVVYCYWFHMWLWLCVAIAAWIANLLVVWYVRGKVW